MKVIADKNGGLFVDQFHPYLAVLDGARGKGPKYERITGGDAVHPGPPGQALMAASILKGLSFPALVSSAEIDAAGGRVVAAKNCKVDSVAQEGWRDQLLSSRRSIAILPCGCCQYSAPCTDSRRTQRLPSEGHWPGCWPIRSSHRWQEGCRSDQQQLAAGANLAAGALTEGPIADQAKAVRAAVEKKNSFHHDQIFRGIVLSNVPGWVYDVVPKEELEAKKQAVIAQRLAKLLPLDAEVAKALEMKANLFEIVPVK